MQCQHAHELFSDYISGETDRALTLTLDNHIADCTACKSELADLRKVWSALDSLPTVEPPMFFHENIMAQVSRVVAEKEEARSKGFDWRSLFRPRSLALAASAVAVIVFMGAGSRVTQMADLDPLGGLLHRSGNATAGVVPAAGIPALSSARAEWVPGTSGGGVLNIHLRARSQDGAATGYSFQLLLNGRQLDGGRGIVTSDQTVSLEIPVDAPPANGALSVTLAPANAGDPKSPTAYAVYGVPVSGAAP